MSDINTIHQRVFGNSLCELTQLAICEGMEFFGVSADRIMVEFKFVNSVSLEPELTSRKKYYSIAKISLDTD